MFDKIMTFIGHLPPKIGYGIPIIGIIGAIIFIYCINWLVMDLFDAPEGGEK